MNITFLNGSGQKIIAEAKIGESVMSVAIRNGINGIVGECGGSLSCATCHVYVHGPEEQPDTVIDEMEDAMLDGAACERRPGSRLSCQIIVNEETMNWEFELPESQY